MIYIAIVSAGVLGFGGGYVCAYWRHHRYMRFRLIKYYRRSVGLRVRVSP